MPKFEVTAIFGASKYLGEIEAPTHEDAICTAYEKLGTVGGQCHACSQNAELNTEVEYMVAEGEDGSSVEDSVLARFQAEIDRLKAVEKTRNDEIKYLQSQLSAQAKRNP